MMRALRQILRISWATWLEAIQRPVAFLLAATSVVTTLCVPVFNLHRFGEDGRLARDSGLSCLLLFGLALAVGAAGKGVAGEIESGTAAAALGKPVSRETFVLGKWLGVTLLVFSFAIAQVSATIVAERCSAHEILRDDYIGPMADFHTLLLALAGVAAAMLAAAALHYALRRRFGVTVFGGLVVTQPLALLASHWTNNVAPANLRILSAALLVLFALAIFSALATALATRLQTAPVLAICTAALLLGLAGEALPLSGLLPDLQNFWLCDAIARGGRIANTYLLQAAICASLSCAFFLCIGCILFRGRDLG